MSGNLTDIRTDALDALTDGLIQRLPPSHRLRKFCSDIPAWLEERDKSAKEAKCNMFIRSAHRLANFGIHTALTFNTCRMQLNKSCEKAKGSAMTGHIEAKILHLTRNPFPIEDIIHAAINSKTNINMDFMVAALRAHSNTTTDLLCIDRICTWTYWTVTQQQK